MDGDTGSLDAKVRRAYRIVGRVQGVGFRWWTSRTAARLGIGGSVRNLRDGSVEVQAVGSVARLEALEAALAAGPPGARVERVEPLAPDASVLDDEFRIER